MATPSDLQNGLSTGAHGNPGMPATAVGLGRVHLGMAGLGRAREGPYGTLGPSMDHPGTPIWPPRLAYDDLDPWIWPK